MHNFTICCHIFKLIKFVVMCTFFVTFLSVRKYTLILISTGIMKFDYQKRNTPATSSHLVRWLCFQIILRPNEKLADSELYIKNLAENEINKDEETKDVY